MKKKLVSISRAIAVLSVVIAVFLYINHRRIRSESLTPGESIPDFALLDHEGEFQRLSSYAGKKAVVIIAQGNSCPIFEQYVHELNELNKKFAPQGISFLLLNANIQDDRKSIIKEAREFGIKLPILLDSSQVVAHELGFTRTAEVVVITPKDGKIVFRGAIDDRLGYGADKQVARNKYLSEFLEAFLKGKSYPLPVMHAKGCAISFREPQLSYTKNIAPIVMEKCLNCHSTYGKFRPAFSGYNDLKGWSAMIRETILSDRMPPWSADTLYGKYKNDVSLSPEEKWDLIQWLEKGMPKDGNRDPIKSFDPTLMNSKRKAWIKSLESKHLLSLKTEVSKVPPKGFLEYTYQKIYGPASRDMWVTAIKYTSNNPRILHHVSMLVMDYDVIARYPKLFSMREKRNELDQEGQTEYVSFKDKFGTIDLDLNDDNGGKYTSRTQVFGLGRLQPFGFFPSYALYIPKGYYVFLEMHHMGTGRWENEQGQIELYGSFKKGSLKRARYLKIRAVDFVVPKNKSRFVIRSKGFPINRDIRIDYLLGHMHMRGRSIKLLMTDAHGKTETLASIPNFYYGWQTGAGLLPEKPILVSAGSKLAVECVYDNSSENPSNPDPNVDVHWGDTFDRTEMCHFGLGIR